MSYCTRLEAQNVDKYITFARFWEAQDGSVTLGPVVNSLFLGSLRMVGMWTPQAPPKHVKYDRLSLPEPSRHVKYDGLSLQELSKHIPELSRHIKNDSQSSHSSPTMEIPRVKGSSTSQRSQNSRKNIMAHKWASMVRPSSLRVGDRRLYA